MKTEINKIVNENVNNKMKQRHNQPKIGIKSPKGTFKNIQTKKSPLSENLHKSVNAARRRKQHRRQSKILKSRGLKNLSKPLPPMHSPPSNVNKINIIPSRPRLPDLDSLQKRNKAEDVLFDAAIDRYRSSAFLIYSNLVPALKTF